MSAAVCTLAHRRQGPSHASSIMMWRRRGLPALDRQAAIASFDRTLARAQSLTAELRRDLERCAMFHAAMARELTGLRDL